MNNQDTRFANQYNIQWFPGHMTKTLRMMEQEIQHVDASLVLQMPAVWPSAPSRRAVPMR